MGCLDRPLATKFDGLPAQLGLQKLPSPSPPSGRRRESGVAPEGILLTVAAVLNGLEEGVLAHLSGFIQVRNGARHFQNRRAGPGGEGQPKDRLSFPLVDPVPELPGTSGTVFQIPPVPLVEVSPAKEAN